MSQQQLRDRLGATPGKLALIGVLAVALMAVIASNWPAEKPARALASTADDTRRGPATEADGRSSGTPQSDQSDDPFGEFATDDNWSAPPLWEVTRFDPLAAPEWATPPQANGEGDVLTQEQMEELLAAQNAIIFMSGETRVARIGDREFKVGDIIGHYKISEISSQGVVLSEVE